jgi:hypothetical protein
VIYVALDVSESSFQTWSQETDLLMPQCYRELGKDLSGSASFEEILPEQQWQQQKVWLDFALFDAEKDTKLNLSRARVQISEANQARNPIFVFGNYLFDRSLHIAHFICSPPTRFSLSYSLTADAFTLRGGELYETLLTLRSSSVPVSLSNSSSPPASLLSSTEIKNCAHEWTHCSIAKDLAEIEYYHHDTFDHLLTSLASQLLTTSPSSISCSTFTLPIGGLRCLERMRHLSGENILISFLADKAYHRYLFPLLQSLPPHLLQC